MKPRRRPTSRWALWLFAAALILKAAMPMLATASAQTQGKALVEVCTVYGMSMVSADADPAAASHAPQPDDTTAHLDHQCALTALAALATADAAPALPLPAARRPAGPAWAAADARPGPDAAAAWLAGRKRGPPTPA